MANWGNHGIFNNGVSVDHKTNMLSSNDIKPNVTDLFAQKSQPHNSPNIQFNQTRESGIIKQEPRPIKQEVKQEYLSVSHALSVQNPSIVNAMQNNNVRTIAPNSNINIMAMPKPVLSSQPNITPSRPAVRIAPQQSTPVQVLPAVKPQPVTAQQLMSLPQLPGNSVMIKNAEGNYVIVQTQPNQKPMQTVRASMPTVIMPQQQLALSNQMRPAGPGTMQLRQQGPNGTSTILQQQSLSPQFQQLSAISTIAATQAAQPVGFQTMQSPTPAQMQQVILQQQQLQQQQQQQQQQQIQQQLQQQQQQQQNKQEAVFDNMKKCKNFLQTLLKLAGNEAGTTESVQSLIQELINGNIEPELFTERLQIQLRSSPQPYLIPFLKRNLPMLRYMLIQQKTKIDGIAAPPIEVMSKYPIPHSHALAHSSSHPQGVPQIGQKQHPQQVLMNQVKQRPPFSQNHKLTPQQVQQIVFQQQQQHQQINRQQINSVQLQQARLQQQMAKAGQQINKSSLAVGSPSTVQALASLPGAKPTPASREKRKFDALREDDDINDVAAMGGVNLMEETKNILSASSSLLSSQMRSCGDAGFLPQSLLHKILTNKAREHGLSECSKEVTEIISHATEELLKQMLTKLSVLADHRQENFRVDSRYEATIDTRQQLKFLEELDKREQKRHEDTERETLMKAAKSRSKNEDPEQLKLKEKAKAAQQKEQDEIRQREANLTALAAIGKRRRLDEAGNSAAGSMGGNTPRNATGSRPRIKRVHLRDLLFVMEQDRRFSKSKLLYKGLMK